MHPRVRAALPAVLLLLAASAVALRAHTVAQPLGIDQSLWASAVRGMDRGQRLYVDVWEQRPPAIYWVYLNAFRLFGWSDAAVAWLEVGATALTTIAVWLVGRGLAGPIAGAAAAAIHACFTMPAALYGYSGFLERAVSETFITVCLAWAAWCAVRLRAAASIGAAAGLGMLAGAAVAFKPNAGLYFPAFAAWVMLYRQWRMPAVPVAAMGAAAVAAAVMPLATLVWLWQQGTLAEARIAIVDFNRYYVAEGFDAARYARAFAEAVWLRMKTQPHWAAGGVAAAVAVWQLARVRRLEPLAGLAVAWGGTSVLVIVANGARLFNSYFIQALPALALLAAWLLAGAPAVATPRVRRVLVVATLILMAALTAHRGYVPRVYDWARADVERLLGRSDRLAYLERFGSYANNRGYSARANAELAEYVRARCAPDDRIFLFGINGAGVYYAADRLTAHRFLRVNFFVDTEFPDPRFRLGAVVDDLIARRPVYIIFERLHSSSEMGRAVDALEGTPEIRRLLARYALETRIEDFTLYRRLD